MNILYSSPQYHIIEYPSQHGFELINNEAGAGVFLQGNVAEKFRSSLNSLIATSPTIDAVDAFLGKFDGLMVQPTIYH